MSESALARLRWHISHPLPLLHHLVLRTESHASCAALGFFAMIGFYPLCLLLLWVSGDLLQWAAGETVIRETLREYYPQGQAFLVRNLEASVEQHRGELTLAASFWILLGAAGVFIPLETAFNGLWGATEHRPYWRNQAVGFLLTAAGVGLAFLFVLVTAFLTTTISGLQLTPFLERASSYTALRLAALSLSVAAIFLLYRFLPNHPVGWREVLPSAIGAGIVAEAVRWVYLWSLPLLELQKSQGPYYISVSFALLAYFEAFVLLGGAFVAARPAEAVRVDREDGGS
jgi:uncharacterized BrkB/YihY/UPF0761 family membrane protein